MNRFGWARLVRDILWFHYDVRMSGQEIMHDGKVHLLLPNHTAYIDPVLMVTSLWDVPICPMSDEQFRKNRLFRYFLEMGNVVWVPDLQKATLANREQAAAVAGQLSRIAIDSLAQGREMWFYPSGHIKLVDKEVIGNRRMAYEVCRELPEGVEVVLCRMRGLETSRWSKLKPKRWKWRRTVYFHFEDKTDDLRKWAQTLDRRAFNEKLEQWYNQEE